LIVSRNNQQGAIAMNTVKIDRNIRNAVAGCSSGPIYYGGKGLAWHAVNNVLNGFNLQLEPADCSGDEGHTLLEVCPQSEDGINLDDSVGCVSFSWYRMPSGRYELTVYMP